jgi:dTDP-glucose 4,6-dehydratase/UDP-glucose 4,6-dehydratase
LKEDKKCTIHGINSANVRRAFMHVHDVVDAVEVVWKSGKSGEVYNIASDDELSVMDVTKLIIKTLKNTEEYDEWIEYVEDRPFNDRRYHICAKKLKELGWSQKRTREDLVKYIQD